MPLKPSAQTRERSARMVELAAIIDEALSRDTVTVEDACTVKGKARRLAADATCLASMIDTALNRTTQARAAEAHTEGNA